MQRIRGLPCGADSLLPSLTDLAGRIDFTTQEKLNVLKGKIHPWAVQNLNTQGIPVFSVSWMRLGPFVFQRPLRLLASAPCSRQFKN